MFCGNLVGKHWSEQWKVQFQSNDLYSYQWMQPYYRHNWEISETTVNTDGIKNYRRCNGIKGNEGKTTYMLKGITIVDYIFKLVSVEDIQNACKKLSEVQKQNMDINAIGPSTTVYVRKKCLTYNTWSCAWDRRLWYNQDQYKLYCSQDIVRTTTAAVLRWTRQIQKIGNNDTTQISPGPHRFSLTP